MVQDPLQANAFIILMISAIFTNHNTIKFTNYIIDFYFDNQNKNLCEHISTYHDWVEVLPHI